MQCTGAVALSLSFMLSFHPYLVWPRRERGLKKLEIGIWTPSPPPPMYFCHILMALWKGALLFWPIRLFSSFTPKGKASVAFPPFQEHCALSREKLILVSTSPSPWISDMGWGFCGYVVAWYLSPFGKWAWTFPCCQIGEGIVRISCGRLHCALKFRL